MSPPTEIAHYRITSKLGEGGMGAVYRATDTKLNRDVAIKILPDAFAADPGRMARFTREAQVLASLNHPNIATIYGVEDSAIVMELVEGASPAGPLSAEAALPLIQQLIDALEYAHEKGIVHRDLKPANLKVTPEGRLKVLDFGLAKALSGEPSPTGNPMSSPTLTMQGTAVGVIMGTAGYMSPEQARGQNVDRRADIWAFGVVAYELLTGEKLFSGATVSDSLAAVLTREPDLDRIPAQFRRVVRLCLMKDPRKRLRDIADARLLLDDPAPVVVQSAPRNWLPWAVAGVLLAVVAALGVVAYRHANEETRILKFSVVPPGKATFTSVNVMAVSPDGRRVAFVVDLEGKRGLAVRDLDAVTARILPGTESAYAPFWSPDSRSLAFYTSGELKRIDVAGGPALRLCEAPNNSRSGSWSQSGVILFGGTRGLLRVWAAGGIAAPVTTLDPAVPESSHRFPWFLPDGHHFLYTALSAGWKEKSKVYVGDLSAKTRQLVGHFDSNAVYVPPGYLLFMRDRTLMAQHFDAGKIQLSGDPVPVAEQVDFVTSSSRGAFSASLDGVLAYSSGGAIENVQMTWLDRAGKMTGTVGAPGNMYWPAISPDGATVALDRQDTQTRVFDIWLHDLARGTASRFTFGASNKQFPVWSPDGSHIAFYASGEVHRKPISGTAPEESLDRGKLVNRPDDWSRDGRYIIEEPIVTNGIHEIWVLPLSGDRKPFPYLQSQFSAQDAALSRDGRWLAYASNETGRLEVYVQSFPQPGAKFQVSTDGGERPRWSRDGKELFFIADRKMMAAAVTGGAKFQAGVPKPLFDSHIPVGNTWFDVSKDGRFLVPMQVENAPVVPITVVVNWMAGLKK